MTALALLRGPGHCASRCSTHICPVGTIVVTTVWLVSSDTLLLGPGDWCGLHLHTCVKVSGPCHTVYAALA